jgi:hypothetical protein
MFASARQKVSGGVANDRGSTGASTVFVRRRASLMNQGMEVVVGEIEKMFAGRWQTN